MIQAAVQKEFKIMLRGQSFWIMALAIVVLVLFAAVIASREQKVLTRFRAEAQAASRTGWLNQSPKNPHSAAHYGNFAFRIPTPLSLFDKGLNAFTGSQVFLEPHKQDDFKFSAAEDADSLLRFGELSPAFILQTILPLLIIFSCFAAVTREKEDNTLKMVLGNGVSMSQLVASKIVAHWLLVAGLLTLVMLPVLFLLPGRAAGQGTGLSSLLLVWLAYLLYAAVVVTACVVISAYSSSSRSSLIKLLCCWMLACVLIPKLTSNLGSTLYPTPSQFEYAGKVAHDEKEGLDGHNPNDVRRESLLQSTLKKYGVDTITQLPVNFDAIAMMESEKHTTAVFRKRIDEVRQLFNKQNKISLYASFVNPYQAIQLSSMAICGTDYGHFTNFQDSAEAYRLYFVNTMNEFMSTHTKSGDWRTKFGQDTYHLISPFHYQAMSLPDSIRQQPVSFIALLTWLLVSIVLVQSTNRIKIVA